MPIAIDIAGSFAKFTVLIIPLGLICKLPDINIICGSAADFYCTMLSKEIKGLL